MESTHEISQERLHDLTNEATVAQHLPQKPNVDAELNHVEAQAILKEQDELLGSQNLGIFGTRPTNDVLKLGDPHSKEQVALLCPSEFVIDVLFQRFGNALNKYLQLKLSDLCQPSML